MKNLYVLIFFFLVFFQLHSAEIIVTHYEDQNIDLPPATDLHITGVDDVLIRSSVNLTSENSWLFFDNIRPSVVLEKYAGSVLINGQELFPEENAQIRVYAHGTVIIPHGRDFQPLEVFKKLGLRGDSQKYSTYTFYRDLGEFDDAIRSFRLKKGYMATFTGKSNGLGYSRVFIADKEDLEMESLPDLLDQTISFIRVFRWDWTSKKGWCGSYAPLADTLNCTWYYSWSADKESTANYQYVPIKQNLGWPGFDEINSKTNVCHLLGYNEPDRDDQSNMKVEDAIEQWPDLLKTGLRLGSPVPSNPGNGNGWLYRFLDKCDSLNYRVDYVVVHAYWGGKSPQNWYNDLKNEYEKCGKRPLWITEWNNGANWTNEYWPAGQEAQKEKQLNDLKKILQVLDTCSFVERYSIYDWVNWGRNVEGKEGEIVRALIWNDKLTPVGEYYKNNKSKLAFNPEKEMIPKWNFQQPTLNYSLSEKTIKLSIEDPNEGAVDRYVVERSINGSEFTTLAEISGTEKTYIDDAINDNVNGNIDYQVKLILKNGSENIISNKVRYNISSGNELCQYGKAFLSDTEWSFFKYRRDYTDNPVVIFGTPSNSATPLSQCLRSINKSSFQFHLSTWSYLEKTNMEADIDIAYFILPEGEHDLNGIKAKTGNAKNVGRNWKEVKFSSSFDEVPAVFVSQISARNQYATTVRVRNVSKSGFEVCLQKELALLEENETMTLENINYLALTPGSGTINNRKIKVGLTEDEAIGTIYSPAKISFGEDLENPIVFGCMQTTSDDIVSTLRYNNLKNNEVRLLRQNELSKGTSPNAGNKEKGAWMVIDMEKTTTGLKETGNNNTLYSLYPNPVSDILFIKNNKALESVLVEIYSIAGQKILEEQNSDQINLSSLNSGVYYVKINKNQIFKILKK